MTPARRAKAANRPAYMDLIVANVPIAKWSQEDIDQATEEAPGLMQRLIEAQAGVTGAEERTAKRLKRSGVKVERDKRDFDADPRRNATDPTTNPYIIAGIAAQQRVRRSIAQTVGGEAMGMSVLERIAARGSGADASSEALIEQIDAT